MQRIVLTFGLIAGAILSIMMVATIPFMDRIGFDNGMLVGYTTMVAAFMMVFFGIKSYRENVGGGQISFGRAFRIGAMITLIASICYVVTWQVLFFKGTPGFVDEMSAHMIEKARAGGTTEQELAAKKAEMDAFAVKYRNPLYNSAITFMEVLPVGLLITLVSAAILRRRRDDGGTMHVPQTA